ncbi:sterol desaturase family protein [Yoonia sp. GPGPB17]|uniref:sterol desaturase family protein n=1 Tax=Yoonia sp. GPGPB17 TaxID=3026147 RepID=UPI0030BC02BA
MEELFQSLGRAVLANFLSWDSRLSFVYLAATVLLVYGLWIYRGRPKTFLRWVFPSSVYLHKSNIVDIKIFIFNIVFGVLGFFAFVSFTTAFSHSTMMTLVEWFGQPGVPIEITLWRTVVATVIMVLTLDFCVYWAHYIHHENRFLWPFHALHHSAEVLTPLTSYRNHPVFLLIRKVIFSIVVGFVQGVMLFAFIGEISVLTIGSANAGFVIFNMLGSNLRHSHIWLSYGPVLEHIFISPAQHQIHHSSAPKHHNKNYGSIFAFWDWMFGTLYIPDGHEILEFGIADGEGNVIEQPHPTLFAALFHPFVEIWQKLKAPKGIAPSKTGTPEKTRSGTTQSS